MCLENFERFKDDGYRTGYKVFKKTITPGKYRGVNFTFGGGYILNKPYEETNTGIVADGGYPKGFHIFKYLSDAKKYKCDPKEVVIQVSYSKMMGEGEENGLPVILAGKMTLLGEV